MKVKFLGALLLTATLTFFGCDDNTGTLGIGMLPGSDGISALTTEFPVTTRSVVADSVFAKTSTGYVGRFTDPLFGYYEASFLTEFHLVRRFFECLPYECIPIAKRVGTQSLYQY